MQEYLIFLTAVVKMYSISCWLFIKPGMQERGTECGECRERRECSLEFRGISWRISGNVLILAFRGMLEKLPGNVRGDSGKCSRRFRGMSKKIPGNAIKNSGVCSRRLRGMFGKIPGNAFIFKLVKATFFLKKHMLSYSRGRDLSLLYLMKQ